MINASLPPSSVSSCGSELGALLFLHCSYFIADDAVVDDTVTRHLSFEYLTHEEDEDGDDDNTTVYR